MWNDISTYQNKKGRGRGKQRVSCGITLARQWLIKPACCEDETNVVVYQSCGPSSSDRHGDQMRGVRHLYFLHSLNPSWCWKTSGPACGGDASEAKWERGGQGELSAQIVLSGSKQGTYWAVMYRGWKGCGLWRRESQPLCYVYRPVCIFRLSHLLKISELTHLRVHISNTSQVVRNTQSAWWVLLVSAAIDLSESMERKTTLLWGLKGPFCLFRGVDLKMYLTARYINILKKRLNLTGVKRIFFCLCCFSW